MTMVTPEVPTSEKVDPSPAQPINPKRLAKMAVLCVVSCALGIGGGLGLAAGLRQVGLRFPDDIINPFVLQIFGTATLWAAHRWPADFGALSLGPVPKRKLPSIIFVIGLYVAYFPRWLSPDLGWLGLVLLASFSLLAYWLSRKP